MSIPVQIKFLNENSDLPKISTLGSAGLDLCASILDSLTLEPNTVRLIPTGIAIYISAGYRIKGF